MKASETSEAVAEIIVPDFSAFDISDFLLAIYGGPLPAATLAFEQVSFFVKLHLPNVVGYVRRVFVQIKLSLLLKIIL